MDRAAKYKGDMFPLVGPPRPAFDFDGIGYRDEYDEEYDEEPEEFDEPEEELG
jgi:hypothetical protein